MTTDWLTGDRERGAISLWAVIVGGALIPVTLGLYDGSQVVRADRQATSLAAEAARAASQELDPAAITGQASQVDTARAATAARKFLAGTGAQGTVQVRGERVIITVEQTAHGVMVGDHTMTGQATAEAQRSLGGDEW